MKLTDTDFLSLVKNGILLSIDLIVKNEQGEVLLGVRKNHPAQGYWFVPGGRIFKGERIAGALERIGREELGIALKQQDFHFLGVFEHFYDDNFSGIPGVSTHYVVLAGEVSHAVQVNQLPGDQHREWRFWSVEALMKETQVHPYTQAYFEKVPTTLALK